MPSPSNDEERIRRLGKRLHGVYSQAHKELAEKVNSFFANFERMDKEKAELVRQGKLSDEEYQRWRRNKLLMGKNYQNLRDNVCMTMLDANRTAAAYINRELIPTYMTGFNTEGRNVSEQVKGYSFDLIDEDAVKKLVTSKETLLPYKVVDGKKDVRWNTKQVNSAILQGIIQGDSLPKIAKRLEKVAGMNEASAKRNARTALTGAHNAGRFRAMKQMAKDGVILQKEWIATSGDGRTRHAHAELNHVVIDYDEPFENSLGEIMYPGDPDAEPANVYNCRCAMATIVKGFRQAEESEDEEEPVDEGLNTELDDVWNPKGDYLPAGTKAEFIKLNKDSMKADGVKGNELMDQYEDVMMHEAQKHLRHLTEQEAVDVAREEIPESYRRGWFVDADSEYKPKIEQVLLGDPEIMNAGWNIAYRNFSETVGKDSGMTFEEFMYTPIHMYRGTSGQSEIASDVWSSFSMDRKIAEGFAGRSGSVEEITIRPIDTWGSYQTTGEAEVLVPRRMLKKLRGED